MNGLLGLGLEGFSGVFSFLFLTFCDSPGCLCVFFGCGYVRRWSMNTVVVVTGGDRGLGFGIVCELARRGFTVVLTSGDAEEGLAAVEAASKVEPKGSGCMHFHQLDVTDEHSVAELLAWLRIKFGGIDILVSKLRLNLLQIQLCKNIQYRNP
jgi:hypothetical protein